MADTNKSQSRFVILFIYFSVQSDRKQGSIFNKKPIIDWQLDTFTLDRIVYR